MIDPYSVLSYELVRPQFQNQVSNSFLSILIQHSERKYLNLGLSQMSRGVNVKRVPYYLQQCPRELFIFAFFPAEIIRGRELLEVLKNLFLVAPQKNA